MAIQYKNFQLTCDQIQLLLDCNADVRPKLYSF